MTDEFQTFPLTDDQVTKLRSDNGVGLDSESVAKFQAAITQKFHGGMELDHISLDDQHAVLRRVRVLTEVTTGVDGVLTVTPRDKSINDGRKFAAWASLHHPDLEVLDFSAVAHQGSLGKMDPDVTRCREAVAQVMGCDPWDVDIGVARDSETGEAQRFDLKLPSYFPSKHLAGLTEVATEIVGDYRWTVRVDAQTKEASLELVPDRLDKTIPWVREETDLARGIRIGEQADGEPWRLPVLGTHKLIAAETRWGKGSVLWGYVRGLASAIQEGTVVVWGIDLKGGVEVSMGREFFGRVATTHAEALMMLRAARMMMEARLKAMSETRSRQHIPSVGDPAIVLLFDEFSALRLAAPDSKAKAAAEAEMTLLLSQGGAPNVLVTAFLQSPQAKDVPARDFFPTRILGKIPNARLVNTVLGDMAKESGADATKLPARLKGTFYVASDGGAAPVRCRAHYSTDDAISAEALAVADGALAGQAALDRFMARFIQAEEDSGEPDPGEHDSGAWRETDRETCPSCEKPINPETSECACTS